MLFKALHTLLAQDRKHVTLSVAPAGEDKLLVTITPFAKDTSLDPAINHPLQVSGTPDELDEGLHEHVGKYQRITMEAADNLADIQRQLDAAVKAKSAKSKGSSKATPTPTAKTAPAKAEKKTDDAATPTKPEAGPEAHKIASATVSMGKALIAKVTEIKILEEAVALEKFKGTNARVSLLTELSNRIDALKAEAGGSSNGAAPKTPTATDLQAKALVKLSGDALTEALKSQRSVDVLELARDYTGSRLSKMAIEARLAELTGKATDTPAAEEKPKPASPEPAEGKPVLTTATGELDFGDLDDLDL